VNTGPHPRDGSGRRRRQRGIAAIEFALVFTFGILPLLLLCLTGVMIMAAKQTLSLAVAEGARAALRYQPDLAARQATARAVAAQRMQWLLNFSGTGAEDAIDVTQGPCPSDATVTCIGVTAHYDYDAHPFLPGTVSVYHWTMGASGLRSTALVQLDGDDTGTGS
jgi:Flp pilus assembly protein TadG